MDRLAASRVPTLAIDGSESWDWIRAATRTVAEAIPGARAAGRGEARADIRPVIATLPTDLFRHQLFLTRTPPSEGIIAEIVDDVFLPLVRP